TSLRAESASRARRPAFGTGLKGPERSDTGRGRVSAGTSEEEGCSSGFSAITGEGTGHSTDSGSAGPGGGEGGADRRGDCRFRLGPTGASASGSSCAESPGSRG